MHQTLYDEKTEGEVLASIIFNNENLSLVSDFLLPESFYNPLHKIIYSSILILLEKSKVAEPATLALFIKSNFPENAETREEIEKYLLEIIAKHASSIIRSSLETQGSMVKDLHQRREILRIFEDSIQKVIKPNQVETAEDAISATEEQLYKITEKSGLASKFADLSSLFSQSLRHIEIAKKNDGMTGIPTGFTDLSHYIHGWQPGDLIIIAGRPSMGKTAFAISVALNAAKALVKDQKNKAKSVAVFSLEMSSEQLTNRIIAIYSGVPTHKINSGNLTDAEFALIHKVITDFDALPLFIDDTPAITLTSLRNRARRLKRKSGLSMIIVDYLQLMRASERSNDNRVQEISEITQGLKAIARELKVPLIALSQLSRGVESRENKRPQLQDLRESGSIEQDADIVMFLYREAYYMAREMPHRENLEAFNQWIAENGETYARIENIAEVIIGKHRNGPIGTANLRFDQSTTKFDNLA